MNPPTQATQVTQPTQQSEETQEKLDPNHLCRLICTTGQYTSFDLSISNGKSTWIFGRNTENDIVLENSSRYLNRHFKLWFNKEGKSLWIQDMSTNGTFLNNNRLVKGSNYMINQGDEILIGKGVKKDELKFVMLFNELFNPNSTNQSILSHEGIYKDFVIHNETIGQGAFATVKKVIERSTGDSYAVKIINRRKALNTGGGMVEVQRELSILRKLNHPNIVSLKSFYEDIDNYYLVMEFVPGGDLMDFVTANGPLEEVAAQVVTKQILQGINYVHKLGISHRDLKPDNILIMQDDPVTVKITDFGLAKISDNSTFMKTFCGTLAYVAPEIITGKYGNSQSQTQYSQQQQTLYDNSVDMWSLGCLVYVILTGHLPFNGTTQPQMFAKIKSGEYHMSPLIQYKISKLGISFLSKCLIVKPENRLTSEQALNHDWITCIQDESDSQISLSQSQSQQLRKIDKERVDNGIAITSLNKIDDDDLMMRPLKKEEFKVPKRIKPLPQSQSYQAPAVGNNSLKRELDTIERGINKKFKSIPAKTFMILKPTKELFIKQPILLKQGINPFAIGRNETCDAFIIDDRMSKVHCLINKQRHQIMELSIYESPAKCLDDIWLLDFSTNSCFVNGQVLGKGKKIQLFDGDKVDFFNDRNTGEQLSYILEIIDDTGLFNNGKRLYDPSIESQDLNDMKLKPLVVDTNLVSIDKQVGYGGSMNNSLRLQRKSYENSILKRANMSNVK